MRLNTLYPQTIVYICTLMNYLAHAHLSFGNEDILIGNMIADYVKGKQINLFSTEVQKGIRLHRLIDEYTDTHTVVKETKLIYRQSAGRYDGSFLDITFDHFLALDKLEEPPVGWLKFTLDCYQSVDNRLEELPERFVNSYQYMKAENWLYNYRYRWLIERNFARFAYHIKYLDANAPVYQDFTNNYIELKQAYESFYPDLKRFVIENS